VTIAQDDLVESGSVNADGPLRLRAVATAEASTFAGIVKLVSQAMSERAPFVRLADRFAIGFVPFAVALCLIAWGLSGSSARAVAVLVVATPCPLILATPIALAAGLSRLARAGVIVKGGGVLEQLAGATVVVFDKTGTVTRGRPVVIDVVTAPGVDPDTVLRLAASVEQASPHLLASSIVRAAADRKLPLSWPEQVNEQIGLGAEGVVDGCRIRVGRAEWLGLGDEAWIRRVRRRAELDSVMTVFVSLDGRVSGALLLEDPVRPDATRSVRSLRAGGVRWVVMATGDRQAVGETVGAVLGVDEVVAQCSPAMKVEQVQRSRERGITVMIGDGVNDAPALAAADVGIALGARGASAASDAADVVVAPDRIDRVVEAFGVARRSRRIAFQSAAAGMGLSVVAMAVAALGYLPALAGAVTQEVIDVVVILNALRGLLPAQRPVAVSAAEAALGQRIASEHVDLRPQLGTLRAMADDLDDLTPSEARLRLDALRRLLHDELLPHERREEEEFYPVVARLLGGTDPLGPMTRAHVEIARLVAAFERIMRDLPADGPDEEGRRDLRRVLYGLHAVLALHFAQEDEGYLSILAQDAGSPDGDRTPVRTRPTP
jgi:heavy metal translocating P-type ATPase